MQAYRENVSVEYVIEGGVLQLVYAVHVYGYIHVYGGCGTAFYFSEILAKYMGNLGIGSLNYVFDNPFEIA
jgi:hypothetical protein